MTSRGEHGASEKEQGRPSGVYMATIYLDGKEIGSKAEVVPEGQAITNIEVTVPVYLKAIIGHAESEVMVRIDFDPSVWPHTESKGPGDA